jgi:hypothetical protein
VFNLVVTATHTESPTFSLTPSSSDDKLGFSETGTATGMVNLNITIAIADVPNLSAQDATTVILNDLNVGGTAQAPGTFPIGIGLLGATVSGGNLGLAASAVITLVNDGTSAPQPNPVSATLGTTAANLLNLAERPSSVTGTLDVAANFGDLMNATATLYVAGDPLNGTPLSYNFNGSQGTSFQSFANLDATDLLGGLTNLGAALTDIDQSSALSTDVPLTDQTVGQAANFGALFSSDVIDELSNTQNNSPLFTSIQQFGTELAGLPGVSGSNVNYTDYNNDIEVGFTLAGSFAATPASFTYDLTGQAGTTLGQLADVQSTSAEATLSINGSGTVTVGFDFSLTPTSVQLRAATPVPAHGALPAGADAHFTLSLSAPGDPAPTNVNVTLSAAATQTNTLPQTLLVQIDTALQTALTGAGLTANLVTATFAPGSNLLLLTLVPGTSPGSFTDMRVLTAPDDPAVYVLGLAPASTPTAAVLGNAPLPSSITVGLGTTFTVTADGGTPAPITIAAGTYSQAQLLTAVQTALATFNQALTAANRFPIVGQPDQHEHLVIRHLGLRQHAIHHGEHGGADQSPAGGGFPGGGRRAGRPRGGLGRRGPVQQYPGAERELRDHRRWAADLRHNGLRNRHQRQHRRGRVEERHHAAADAGR